MSTNVSVATKPATKVVKKQGAYKINVLSTNKALRTNCKTLGGAVKLLWVFRNEINLSARYIKIIRAIMQDDVIYKAFKANCRISKAGNYAPFFVLQAIHKSLKK